MVCSTHDASITVSRLENVEVKAEGEGEGGERERERERAHTLYTRHTNTRTV